MFYFAFCRTKYSIAIFALFCLQFISGCKKDTQKSNSVSSGNGATINPWTEVGSLNANEKVYAVCTDSAGTVYVAGKFTNSIGKNYVAKWDGNTWSELGSGIDTLKANNSIMTLCCGPDGSIYAGGFFTNSSGNYYVARWNGVSWVELDTVGGSLFANGAIRSICVDPAGNVYAGGDFCNSKYYVAKWDGHRWSQVGAATWSMPITGIIFSICSDPSGNIYAAGEFANANGHYYVAKWDLGVNLGELTPCILMTEYDVFAVIRKETFIQWAISETQVYTFMWLNGIKIHGQNSIQLRSY